MLMFPFQRSNVSCERMSGMYEVSATRASAMARYDRYGLFMQSSEEHFRISVLSLNVVD